MEICKNKRSRKYFIFIHDSRQDEALFVTPNCEIKSFKQDLFDEPEEGNEGYFISQNLISKEQAKRYSQNEENRSAEIAELKQYLIEKRRDILRQKFLKEYDRKLRKW